MKTKLLIILAMLLLSTSSFAQSENIGTLKGDVNGDGKVDVADINAVLSIMKKGEAGYFYLGTTRPTAWGYQTLPGVVASYTSIGEASGTTVSVAAGETLYMLCPVGWMEGKDLEIEDGNGNTFSFLEDFDAVTISGYVIYKTQVWTNAAEITLKSEPVESRKHLFTASGTDYNSLQPSDWTDRGEFINGMQIVIPNGAYEYVFIKTDFRDNVSALKVNADIPAAIQDMEFVGPFAAESGYHYYRTEYSIRRATSTVVYGIEKEVAKKNVLVGHGPDYANAIFKDTGEQLREGLHLTQAVNENDYLFLKIDKTQKIELVTTDNDNSFWNIEIEFEAPVIDGNYKVYKTKGSYPRALTARIIIVTI